MAADTLVTIGADLSSMRREIAKLPNMVDSSAQAALIKYERTLHKAEQAAKKANRSIARANRGASKATTKHGKALDGLQDAAGDADSTIMGLTGSLDMFSSKAGDAATVAGDVGAGIESIVRIVKGGNPALLALAAVTAAIGVGYSLWAAEQEAHKRVVDASTQALENHHDLIRDLDSANRDLRVTLGLVSEEDAQIAAVREAAHQRIKPQVEALNATISEQAVKVDEARREWVKYAEIVEEHSGKSSQQLAAEGVNLATMAKRRDEALDTLIKERHELTRRNDELKLTTGRNEELLASEIANIEATHMQRLASEEAAAARELEAEAARAAAEAKAKAAADALAAEQALSAERELSILHRQRIGEITEAEAALVRQMDAEIASVLALGEASGMRAEAEIEAYQTAIDFERELGELRDEEAAKEAKRIADLEQKHRDQMLARDEQARALHEARMAENMEMADAVVSSTADILGSISQIADVQSDQRMEAAREAKERSEELAEAGMTAQANAAAAESQAYHESAVKAFNRSQSLAKSEVAINAAMGIAKAWADAGGNPILAIPLSAAIGAAAIAQLATIDAQSPPAFDIGGIVSGGGIRSRSPDSVPAMLRPGEGVLTRRGVDALGGPQGLHAANRGQPSITMVPVETYRHFDRFSQDELRRNGHLTRAIRRAGSSSSRAGRRGY